ncbi:hypothetical protein cyc_03502 [Cyclospora cayetanensis]|uniref:Uncharacterized protein n=1 Tax=Cyclospora cayetanensis TaxID=88456 RepID=A0A1D3CRS5_9EIME|nr:hypothetical protein cyc_03502 [Cyclospora cayetanensis]
MPRSSRGTAPFQEALRAGDALRAAQQFPGAFQSYTAAVAAAAAARNRHKLAEALCRSAVCCLDAAGDLEGGATVLSFLRRRRSSPARAAGEATAAACGRRSSSSSIRHLRSRTAPPPRPWSQSAAPIAAARAVAKAAFADSPEKAARGNPQRLLVEALRFASRALRFKPHSVLSLHAAAQAALLLQLPGLAASLAALQLRHLRQPSLSRGPTYKWCRRLPAGLLMLLRQHKHEQQQQHEGGVLVSQQQGETQQEPVKHSDAGNRRRRDASPAVSHLILLMAFSDADAAEIYFWALLAHGNGKLLHRDGRSLKEALEHTERRLTAASAASASSGLSSASFFAASEAWRARCLVALGDLSGALEAASAAVSHDIWATAGSLEKGHTLFSGSKASGEYSSTQPFGLLGPFTALRLRALTLWGLGCAAEASISLQLCRKLEEALWLAHARPSQQQGEKEKQMRMANSSTMASRYHRRTPQELERLRLRREVQRGAPVTLHFSCEIGKGIS